MILVVGEILIDEYHFDNEVLKKPGGAPFNVACNIRHFGSDVAFYGAVGRDDDGQFLTNFAKSKLAGGAYISTLEHAMTTRAKVSLIAGERDFVFLRNNGADYQLDFNYFEKIVMNVKPNLIHVGSLLVTKPSGRAFMHALLAFVKKHNIPLSFDLNYRNDIFGPLEDHKTLLQEIFNQAAIIKFSEDEFLMYTHKETIAAGAKTFKRNKNALLVISCGETGATYFYKNMTNKVSAVPVKSVDTTGAGDAFYAYLLHALVNDLHSLDEDILDKSVKRANIIGGLATLKHGAIDILPSSDELKLIIEQHEKN